MCFESDYRKNHCLHEDWNKLSSNVSSRELLSVLHFPSLLVKAPLLIARSSHRLYMQLLLECFFYTNENKLNEKYLSTQSCACHTHRHHYTLPTSWLYSFKTNCSFGFGMICVDKHIQVRQVQKIQKTNQILSDSVLVACYRALMAKRRN